RPGHRDGGVAAPPPPPARPGRRGAPAGRPRQPRLPPLAEGPGHPLRDVPQRSRGFAMTHATDEHLRQLPKAELHCQVEAASGATTSTPRAACPGAASPVNDPADLYEFTSLNQFLSIYDVICASLQTADDFRRITYEALEDGAAAGVRYREMFFSP